MIERLRRCLIHKLGGFTERVELPPERRIVRIPGSIKVCAEQSYPADALMGYDRDLALITCKRVADLLAQYMLKNRFIYFQTREDPITRTVVVRGTVRLVPGEEVALMTPLSEEAYWNRGAI